MIETIKVWLIDSAELLWKWFEELFSSAPIDLARVLILFLTLLILYRKLRQMLNESKRNHLLQKKQMTITYLQKIRNDYRESVNTIEQIYPGETLIPSIIDNETEKLHIDKTLSVVEHLCVPINEDIYDLDTLKKMSNQYFKNLYVKYEGYIIQARLDANNQTKYIEFEKLYQKLD